MGCGLGCGNIKERVDSDPACRKGPLQVSGGGTEGQEEISVMSKQDHLVLWMLHAYVASQLPVACSSPTPDFPFLDNVS